MAPGGSASCCSSILLAAGRVVRVGRVPVLAGRVPLPVVAQSALVVLVALVLAQSALVALVLAQSALVALVALVLVALVLVAPRRSR